MQWTHGMKRTYGMQRTHGMGLRHQPTLDTRMADGMQQPTASKETGLEAADRRVELGRKGVPD